MFCYVQDMVEEIQNLIQMALFHKYGSASLHSLSIWRAEYLISKEEFYRLKSIAFINVLTHF